MTLRDEAQRHLIARVRVSDEVARRVLMQWRTMNPAALDVGWDAIAPTVDRLVTVGQVRAARQSTVFVNRAAQGAAVDRAVLVPEAFGGVTREGREIAPELFTAVASTKTLIGRGVPVPQAFRAGAAFMSVMAATLVRDAGRSADSTLAVGKGLTYSVRVIQPGACSRCAILAGVKGYRADFKRHPGCRCTSMPLFDSETPEGFFRSVDDYFDSLSEAEQERVFTKSGAWAIRNGADPVKVVNARRGANGISYSARGTGRASPGRLRPVTIGVRPDGSPLQVFATTEGTTARSSWARGQGLNDAIATGDRYRRTDTLRLMPEQIMQMSSTPERARELLQRYGYIY